MGKLGSYTSLCRERRKPSIKKETGVGRVLFSWMMVKMMLAMEMMVMLKKEMQLKLNENAYLR